MTKQEIIDKINKLENGIKSKATPSNLITPLKAQKRKFEELLKEREEAEKKAVKTKKVSKVAEKIKAAKTSVAKKTPAKAPAKEERKKDNITRDGDRKSLRSGKRISKSGKVYYETRANRSDKQTSKKPYLSDGGETDGYSYGRLKGFESQDWEKMGREYAGSEWDNLSKNEKDEIITDLQKDWNRNTSFAKGGEIEETKEFKKQMIKNNKETIEYLKNKLERAQKIGQSENDIKTIKENIDFHTQIVREYEKELNELKNKDMNYAKGGDVKKHKVVTSKESYANDLLKYADLQNIPASSKMLGNKFIVTFDAIPKAMDSMTQDVKNLVNKMDKGGYMAEGGMMAKGGELSVFAKNQIKIAKDTLKMSNEGASLMGGMTKDEAKKILEKYKIKMADGGYMAEGGELNLLVRKMASQKGLTPKKLGADYELVMAQAAVDAFTDANYHDAARKLVSILENKPEIAVKPDYPSVSDPEFKVKSAAINEKYDSKYWHGDEKTRDFAVKVSQNSGWDGNGIAGAFEYLLRMEGYHRLADNIKKSVELSDAEKIADFAYENDIYATGNSFEDFSRRIKEKSGTNYVDEDLQTAYNLLSNVRYEKGGYMAYGGKTKTMKSIKDLTIEQISSMTGVGKAGVERFSDENNLTESDLSNIMQGLGRRMISASDFATAVSGEKDNQYTKEIVDFAKSGKGYKMADGGKTKEKLAEYLVTLTDEDGYEDDLVVMAKNEDDAVYKAEQIKGYESSENGVVMLTDFDGNKIEYKKGGYMADGGQVKVGDILTAKTGVKVKVVEYDPKFGGRVRVERIDEYATGKPSVFMPLSRFIMADGGYMAKGGQVPAHFGSGKNINVFGYQTENFDICGTAVKEFESAIQIMDNGKEVYKESLAKCAKYIDSLFGIEKYVVENEDADDANFYEAISSIMSASIYNYRAEMSINLFSFVPQHLKEIAVRMGKAEKGGLYALGGMTAGRWYKDKSGEEFKFIGKVDSGANKGRFLFSDGQKSVYKELEDFEGGKPKETKLFGFFEDGGSVAEGNYEMLMSNIKAIKHHAEELAGAVTPDTEIEAWVLSKSERAETDLSDITHYLDGLKMEKGGYMADGGMMDVVNAEISTIKRNIMGTTSFVMKIKGMRNPQDFIVYPISADQAGQPIMIQSDTRIGFLDLSSGRGLMSQSHANGAYRHHFTMDKKVPFKISETDLQRLKEHISGTAGSSVGNMGISSDNSGASMMAKGGGVEKFNEGDKFYDTQEQRLVEIKNVRKDGVIEFHSITEDNDFFFTEPLIKKVLNSGVWFKISDELGMASKVEKFNEGDKFYDTQEQRLVEIKNVRKDGVIEFHSITEDNDFYLSNSLLKKGLNSGVWFKILDELGMGLKAKGGYMAKGGKTEKKKFTAYTILNADEYGNRNSSIKMKPTKFYIVWYGNSYQLWHEQPHTINSRIIFDNDNDLMKAIDKVRYSTPNYVNYGLPQDQKFYKEFIVSEKFEYAKGGYMAKGGEVRYKLAGNNFGQQIESGKKFAELIKKAHENQTSEHKYPENFIKEIAYTGKIVKNDGTYFLKDYSYKGVLDRFEFLGDKYFLESLKYLNRPTIKNFKFEDGGYMAKGGKTDKEYVVADMNYNIMGSFDTENEAQEYSKKLSRKDGEIYRFGNKQKIERFAKEDGYMAKGGMTRKGGQSFEVNSRKFFYHKDDGNVYDSNHRLYAGSYDTLEQAKKSLEKNFEDIKKGTFFKEGGKVKFADKVKSVQASLLKRKKVAPQVQKDYGKTYNKAEAKESAQRIVGSRMAQLKEKMAKKKK